MSETEVEATARMFITVGAGVQQPEGSQRAFARGSSADLAALLNRLPAAVEAWWSPHKWLEDHRGAATWTSSCAFGVDVDYQEEGAHAVVPQETAARVQSFALARQLPGSLFHLTPRGFRLVFVLQEECNNGVTYLGAVAAVEHRVRCALARNGLPNFRVDTVVTSDLARLLYAPRAIVGGVRRGAEVLQLRAEPYALESFTPSHAKSIEEAIANYNHDHRQAWPRSGGSCPGCGHRECFGELPDDHTRWACFSASHGNVGLRGDKCWHGDVLDLDAAALGVRPVELLRRLNYLAPSSGTDACAPARRDAQVQPATGEANADGGDEIVKRYVYVREQDAYVEPASGVVLTRAALNSTHAADKLRGVFASGKSRGPKPSQFIDERARQADNLGWWPGKETLYKHDGKVLVNTFRPPVPPPLDAADPTLWLEHMEWLIPVAAEREHLLDVLSYNVQHLEGKVNHALVLGGGIRTGKDLLLQPLSKWLGSSYVNVKHEDLDGAFTHYLKGAKFLTVQEARDLSFEQGFTRYNAFKTVIASPPDELTINEKFMRPYKMPNLVQVIFLTNYPNGVYFEDKGDGRYFVIWSPVEPRDAGYYVRLGSYVETSYMEVIGHLARRDITSFNPKALPPSTAAREEMHAATRSGAELALVEAADELAAELGGVFTKAELKAAALRMGHRGLSALLDSAAARIGKTLKDAGLEGRKIKVVGKPVYIYWHRQAMDAATAEQAYRRRARIGPAFGAEA